jgi:Card1-like, endonuclease domain
MANPLKVAQELQRLIEKVLSELRMADGPREKVELALIKTSSVVSLLSEVNNNVIPLEFEEALHENLRYWNEAEAGKIRPDNETFGHIITNSETLDCLKRAGVDIKELTKFSSGELEIAKELGGRFRDWYWGIHKIKQSISEGGLECNIYSNRGGFEALRDFLTFLRKREIVGEYRALLYNYSIKDYEECDKDKIKAIKDRKHWIGFRFRMTGRQYTTFITGDWYTAYVYQLISKYLTNNKANHELYTKVLYKSPPEIIRSEGDFDIIGKIDNKLLLVECKSGNLGNDIRRLIDKTQMLRKVFKNAKVGVKEYVFWLVYNPLIKENNDIISTIADSAIRTVKPEEIRDALVTLYS